MNEDEPQVQNSSPEHEWQDVGPLVRHAKPGAKVRNSHCGVVETDADGLVTRVAGHLGRPARRDPESGEICEWEHNADPPTMEDVLALPGFVLCDDHPFPAQAAEEALVEDALADDEPQDDGAPPAGGETEREAGDPEPERQVAEVTVVDGDGQHGGAVTDAGDGEATGTEVDESSVSAESSPTDESSGAPE